MGLSARARRWLRSTRAKTVFVTPQVTETHEAPVFIIGVHRSGTTLLRLILDSHSRIAIPRESVFLLPLAEVWRNEVSRLGLLGLGFTPDHILAKLRELSSYFFNAYAAGRGKPRWGDKSPQYVDCLDFIEALYGDKCRYIFIYRHGLDVAHSIGGRPNIKQANPHKEACGDPFVGAARYWARQCDKMLQFESTHSSQVFRLLYEDLMASPEAVARKIFEFIGEAWEPQVLDFHIFEHDAGSLEDPIASASKGFQPSLQNYRKLSTSLLDRMVGESAQQLEKLGYQVP